MFTAIYREHDYFINGYMIHSKDNIKYRLFISEYTVSPLTAIFYSSPNRVFCDVGPINRFVPYGEFYKKSNVF